ncbi:MAG TPA: outer membrane protein transport protein [Opitutaceae bacterium]|nr:outer membrane protein transport protein [Opitutaceae bacterium]
MHLTRFLAPASLLLPALAFLPTHVAATNGMNMEGYGPVATALGGASMAYENGTAAVINNPATLSLLPEGNRLDLALGMLGPRVTATAPDATAAHSRAEAFFMPAFGYAHRRGALTSGFAVFGQGGMGCEYDPDSWRGLGFGLLNRTEVSVGRAIVPLSYRINDQLSVAATIDFVWAGMDLKMAMSGAQFMDLVGTHQTGQASGTIVQSFGQMLATLPAGTAVDYAYFDFSNGSDFTGAARGYGYAAKAGLVYTPSPDLSFGVTYHSQTRLSDLKAGGANIAFQLDVPEMGAIAQTLAGDITVRDFEWPAMFAAGVAWHPADGWMVVCDVRRVFWADVMENFSLRFTADDTSANGSLAGQDLAALLYQDWRDQTVVQLGVAYDVSKRLTLRAGYNHGKDPIPDNFLNCLFPATVEVHLTAGFGWKLSDRSSIDASFAYGLPHEVTNGGGITVRHSQYNLQLLYAFRF